MFTAEPPGAPRNLRLTVQATSIAVTWSPSTETDGRSDLYYQVEYSDPDVPGTFIARYTQYTSYTISNLEPHTSYCIRVSAHNGVSDQDPDRSQSITILLCHSIRRHPLVIGLNYYQGNVYIGNSAAIPKYTCRKDRRSRAPDVCINFLYFR